MSDETPKAASGIPHPDDVSPTDTEKDGARPADSSASQPPRRIPAHDIATLKLCVASAWLHGSISAGRAHELAEVLDCKPGEIEALRDAEEQEARADD